MKFFNIIIMMTIIYGCATQRELTPEQEYRISKGHLCIENCSKNNKSEDVLEYYSSEKSVEKINLIYKTIEGNK